MYVTTFSLFATRDSNFGIENTTENLRKQTFTLTQELTHFYKCDLTGWTNNKK